jgi:peptidoglycan hydrolase-like protein with peptidoglycan-binding domain
MRAGVLLAALGLVATGVSDASQTTPARKTVARSARRRTSHSHHAQRNLQAAPTPERYQEIQQALAARGYYKGPANGAWNPDSVDALKRFQADQNLAPDGKLTSLSLIAMGLGPKRSGGTSPAPGPAARPTISPSEPPATLAAPVTVQSNPAPAPQAPAGAHQ